MKQAASQELFSYWNQARGSRMEPERAELNPGAIRGILANTFILEVDAQLLFPMRIAGTRLSTLFTGDVKGRSFIDLWDAKSKEAIHELLATVLDDRNPAIAGILSAPAGFPPLELELLLLPLRHFGKTHARIIGSLSPCFIPSWLGVVRSPNLQITSMRIIRRPQDLLQLIQPDLNEESTPQTQRFGHLTVMDGGKASNPADSEPPGSGQPLS
jgi:hypothetical protein